MEPLSARLRIGLTGGIGSGKSTVASILVQHGAVVIDTDAIAHRLTAAQGDAMSPLIEALGPSIATADGALDRAAMRRLAFTDASVRRRLEAVLHPMIGAQALREAEAASGRVIVFDVPLLAQLSAWRARVDRVLVVDCGEATQIERVAMRDGWTRETAHLAIAAQSTRAARRAIADAIIVNDNIDLASLHAHVDALWRLWNNGLTRAAPPP